MAFFFPETHDFSSQSSTELIVKTDLPFFNLNFENTYVCLYGWNGWHIVAWDQNRPPVATVNLPSNATGTVTFCVDGKYYSQAVINGRATFTFEYLELGNHTIEIEYSGDNHYKILVYSHLKRSCSCISQE